MECDEPKAVSRGFHQLYLARLETLAEELRYRIAETHRALVRLQEVEQRLTAEFKQLQEPPF